MRTRIAMDELHNGEEELNDDKEEDKEVTENNG